MFTVAFFGDKHVHNPLQIVRELEISIRKLIVEHGQVNLIVGGNEADSCAAMAARRVRKEVDQNCVKLSLLVPYNPFICSNAPEHIARYYDEANYILSAVLASPNERDHVRDFAVAEQADLILSYFTNTKEDSYFVVQCAQDEGKTVVRLKL